MLWEQASLRRFQRWLSRPRGRSAARPEARFQAQRAGGVPDPGLAAERLAPLDAHPQARQFRVCLGAVYVRRPVRPAGHGAGVQKRDQRRRGPKTQTRPGPVLRTLDQVSAQRIAFDIAQDAEQVLVLGDRERFEPTLPNMPAGAVTAMVAADMSGEQPTHPGAEVRVPGRPEHEVKVVRHETVGEQAHGHARGRAPQEAEEGGIIVGIVEDLRAAVAAVEDMVAVAANRGTCGAGHADIMAARAAGARGHGRDHKAGAKRYYDVPFFFSTRSEANQYHMDHFLGSRSMDDLEIAEFIFNLGQPFEIDMAGWEIEGIQSPSDAIDFVWAKMPHGVDDGCLSRRAFYKVRMLACEALGLEKRSIGLRTFFADIASSSRDNNRLHRVLAERLHAPYLPKLARGKLFSGSTILTGRLRRVNELIEYVVAERPFVIKPKNSGWSRREVAEVVKARVTREVGVSYSCEKTLFVEL
jgi:hypothetical protein